MAYRPNRRPKNWKSDGRRTLQRLTSLRRLLDKTLRDRIGHHDVHVGPVIIEFFQEVELLGRATLDSCFESIRQEIRSFAVPVGLEKADFVNKALGKLLADEKTKRRRMPADTSSLSQNLRQPWFDSFHN